MCNAGDGIARGGIKISLSFRAIVHPLDNNKERRPLGITVTSDRMDERCGEMVLDRPRHLLKSSWKKQVGNPK